MRIITIVGSILAFGLMFLNVNAQQENPEMLLNIGHYGYIYSIAYSPDGKILASLGNDLKFWDTATGLVIRTITFPGKTSASYITFRPDGKVLAVGTMQGVQLWDVQTGKFLSEFKRELIIGQVVSFSNDGKMLAAGGGVYYDQNGVNGRIVIWDTNTGKELYELKGHENSVHLVAFNPQNKMLVTVANPAGGDGEFIFWDTETGKEILSFKGHTRLINSIAFNRDGKILASCSYDGTIKLWDAKNGKEILSIGEESQGGLFGVNSLSFISDNLLASGNERGEISIWDIKTGKNLQTMDLHSARISSLAFNPLSGVLASASWNNTIKFWDLKNGKEIINTQRNIAQQTSVAISPDNKMIAIAGSSRIGNTYKRDFQLWNLYSGKQIINLEGEDSIQSISFSPDSKLLASLDAGEKITLWSTFNGEKIRELKTNYIQCVRNTVVFSPDGKFLASAHGNVEIWEVSTGKLLKILKAGRSDGEAMSIALSPDGKALAVGYLMDTIILWDIEGGIEKKKILREGESVYSVTAIAFSPDGKFFASGGDKIKFWDGSSGEPLNILSNHTQPRINQIAFSPDGRTLVTGNESSLEFWDLNNLSKIKTQEIIDRFETTTSDLIFSSNGQVVLNGGETTTRIFNAKNGELLANIFAIDKDSWLVISPNGQFDGTSNTWNQIFWRLSPQLFDVVPIEAFFKEFYYPGLLQEIMSGNTPAPPEKDLSQIDIRQPNLKISAINGKATETEISANKSSVKVKIEISDNINKGRKDSFPASGGANDVRLFRNGSLVKLWENDAFKLGEEDGCLQVAATKAAPRKAVCEMDVQITAGENEFSAYAFNHDNVKSNDATAGIKGAETLKRKGRLQILSVGVNDYSNKNYNLKFAVPDAVDFGAELRKRQINLNNYDTPEVIGLTDKDATKANILYALERFAKGEKAVKPANLSAETEKKFAAIEKTQPEDILVIYFAGHGTAAKDRFYLIPHDGFPVNSTSEQSRIATLQKQSVSDLELEAVLRDLDAGQILLIVDACNSGQALEAEEKRRGPMNSKGLAQLAFEKGMYILTAAQSFQAALEVTRTTEGKDIKHGLLTYSLLEGLQNSKADQDSDKQITEREWFAFAVGEVPRLQLEEMNSRSARIETVSPIQNTGGATPPNGRKRSDIVFLDGPDEANLPPEKRTLQTPRIFFRRESLSTPLIISNLLYKVAAP